MSSPMYDRVQNNGGGAGLQNPDNSGLNVQISPACAPSNLQNPCYGFGVRTDLVSNVSFAMVDGQCRVTVEANAWTDAVAFDGRTRCCGPPFVGGDGVCQGMVRESG